MVGIDKAGENLSGLAHDLVNRIDVIPFETNPNESVQQVITLGAAALNTVSTLKMRQMAIPAHPLSATETKELLKLSFR